MKKKISPRQRAVNYANAKRGDFSFMDSFVAQHTTETLIIKAWCAGYEARRKEPVALPRLCSYCYHVNLGGEVGKREEIQDDPHGGMSEEQV